MARPKNLRTDSAHEKRVAGINRYYDRAMKERIIRMAREAQEAEDQCETA